jgi:hypothetical protein
MGCFLACFGSSKDGRKRMKQGRNKVQPRDHQVRVCLFSSFDFYGVVPCFALTLLIGR